MSAEAARGKRAALTYEPSALPDGTLAEPPPAYEASLASSSTSPADGEGESTVARDEEIRVLVAQKAAIQRRLEELERADAGDTRHP